MSTETLTQPHPPPDPTRPEEHATVESRFHRLFFTTRFNTMQEIPQWMDWVAVGFAILILIGSGLMVSNGAIEAERKLERKRK